MLLDKLDYDLLLKKPACALSLVRPHGSANTRTIKYMCVMRWEERYCSRKKSKIKKIKKKKPKIHKNNFPRTRVYHVSLCNCQTSQTDNNIIIVSRSTIAYFVIITINTLCILCTYLEMHPSPCSGRLHKKIWYQTTLYTIIVVHM